MSNLYLGIMKIAVLLIFILISVINVQAQTFIKTEQDSTAIMEYNDGHMWIYRNIEGFVVGMTNYEEKDDYGSYYQIVVFINNLSDTTITFNPNEISSTLLTKTGDTVTLEVYTYDEYMKKVKRSQGWAMALTGVATGLNAGTAGYSTSFMPNGMPITTYNAAAASAANMAAQTQIMTLGKMMENDRKTKEQGYLKTTTIYPQEAIVGYLNIKRKRGLSMVVNIPINEHLFSFTWDVIKAKRKK